MNESYIYGLVGGMFIGFAAVLLFWFNGRIMGVSGIVSGIFTKITKDSWVRFAFIAGLVLGGYLYQLKNPVLVRIDASWTMLIVAGFLVGFGTVMGNGCTSGHGICGIARLSKRSIIGTIVFIASGIITVWAKKMLGG